MSESLNDYSTKLINQILFARSQQEVKLVIDTTITALELNEVNAPAIPGFTEKIIRELELFNPMKKEAQQWSNIKMAMILFNRIKHRLNYAVN
ncbi:MAG TPA: hypothetical protein PLY34_12795 [Ferruginibacter sp.]|nr:hypothetical protein [Ferruginibacter sp.]HPH89941.1 hypothetical protein [Ferruginibacter sp.]